MKDAAPLAMSLAMLLSAQTLGCVHTPAGPDALAVASSAESADRAVAQGIWGGEHMRLTVTESGAHLEFDCAFGDISEPLRVDAEGRLSIDGVFVRERGGPIRPDDSLPRLKARYTGTLSGNTLTITVTLTDTNDAIGTFKVEGGVEPRLTKCV